ncbi:MAG: helix-turn-helix domain-containing protein [Pseudomonadales bacterium]|jgi:DNA-binding transcriptional regulator YiaG|nr:helix-turn-helix domain-containing protein [Pseudomonadales bacterium]
MYHYTESGLDNVYLTNGYVIAQHSEYGETIAIEDADGLHKVIGQLLANARRPLTGREIRFLRIELNLSQKKLGSYLGVEEQTVGRWERGEVPAPRSNELIIRALYLEWIHERGAIKTLVDRLAELDTRSNMLDLQLEHSGHDWRMAA